MRLWLRVVVALVLAPLLWQVCAVYLEANQGGNPSTMVAASLRLLPTLYLTYTLPALAGIAFLLIPADRLLARIGADLLIVGVAPVLAAAVPLVLPLVIHDARLDAAGVVLLAAAYGLVFGLTVREPRREPLRTRLA